jgi:hypothetical protein
MNFRSFVLFFAVGVATGVVLAQTAPVNKPVSQNAVTTKKAVAKKAVAKKAAAPVGKASTTATRTTSRTPIKKRTVTKRVAVQPRQSAPTPDRYKEIQNALAAKGYLKSEANGVWDAQSVDAMKRYQADQKEEPTGKLTAASLIGLGLAPKTALLSTVSPSAESIPAPQP